MRYDGVIMGLLARSPKTHVPIHVHMSVLYLFLFYYLFLLEKVYLGVVNSNKILSTYNLK